MSWILISNTINIHNNRGRTQTVVINTNTWQIQDDTMTVQMMW